MHARECHEVGLLRLRYAILISTNECEHLISRNCELGRLEFLFSSFSSRLT